MTQQKYVKSTTCITTWHYDHDCSKVTDGVLVPAEPGEIPDSATPCTHCAGGLTCHEVAKLGERTDD